MGAQTSDCKSSTKYLFKLMCDKLNLEHVLRTFVPLQQKNFAVLSVQITVSIVDDGTKQRDNTILLAPDYKNLHFALHFTTEVKKV